MRSKKELYEIVLKKYKMYSESEHTHILYLYICNCIASCSDFNHHEFMMIREDFRNNRPTQQLHPEFYVSQQEGSSVFWDIDRDFPHEGTSIRIAFLEKLIRMNS